MSSSTQYTDRVNPEQTALLAFKFENVRSYRDKEHFSLTAGRYSMPDVVRDLSTVNGKVYQILPAAGVFGANASGKSTLLQAMNDMRVFVLRSVHVDGMHYNPFILHKESIQDPSSFEVHLLINGIRWLYGFKIDDTNVIEEYAYHYPKNRQALLFERKTTSVRFGAKFRKSEWPLLRNLRKDRLLLSLAGFLEEKEFMALYKWFEFNFDIASPMSRFRRNRLTSELLDNEETKERILSYIRAADLGVVDIEQIDEAESLIFSSSGGMYRLLHSTPSFSKYFDPKYESLGTQVWVSLIGRIQESLELGTVLLIDEIDSSLHPNLVGKIVEQFHDRNTNPKCSQLIFNSHNHTLFEESEMPGLRPDQIWLTEKDKHGVTRIFPISDFAPQRNEPIRQGYLAGRYGGVPNLDHSEFFLAAAESQ